MNNSTTKRHAHEQVVFGENHGSRILRIRGEVYVAELVEQSPNSSRRELNLSMLSTVAISIVFLLLAMSFGNAIVHDPNDDVSFSGEWWETPVHLRHQMDLPMDTMRAQLPVNGTHEVLPYTEHFIEVDLPLSEQDVGSPGADLMHVAYGCRC